MTLMDMSSQRTCCIRSLSSRKNLSGRGAAAERIPNSSNPVEKDNDLNVAARQKHNGMAWSFEGSDALSKITVAFRNKEINEWLNTRTIPFTMPASQMSTSMMA